MLKIVNFLKCLKIAQLKIYYKNHKMIAPQSNSCVNRQMIKSSLI